MMPNDLVGFRSAKEVAPLSKLGNSQVKPQESQVQNQLSILNKTLNALGEEVQILEGALSDVMVSVPILNPVAREPAETTAADGPIPELMAPLSEKIFTLTRQANQIARNVQRIRECLKV